MGHASAGNMRMSVKKDILLRASSRNAAKSPDNEVRSKREAREVYLYMCPHTAIYVSSYCSTWPSYCYICVLMLLCVCPHADIYVCTCCCICDLILLCMCAHKAIYVSSCCYMCVLILRYMFVRIQVPASHYSFDSRDKMPPALYEFVNQESKVYMCPHTAIYVFRTAIYNGYKMPPALYEFVNQESNVHCLSPCAPHTTRHTSYYYIYLILLHIPHHTTTCTTVQVSSYYYIYL